jgi:hypothetical protein
VKFGMEDLHAVPIINLEFRENRCILSDASLKGVNEILPHIFCVIHSNWMKFDVKDTYLLNYIWFRKNRPSKTHSLLNGVNEFLFIDSTDRFG